MFLRHGSAILRAPDGDTDNKPGGGGALTEEVQNLVGQMVNAALTDKLGKKLPGAIAEALKGQKWDEILAPVVTGQIDKYLQDVDVGDGDADTDTDTKPGKKPKGGKPDSAIEQQLQKLATELENERKARAAAEDAAKSAESKRLMDGAVSEFRNGLQSKIRPDLLDAAMTYFGNGLKVSEDGAALLRVKKAPFKGAPLEDMDLPLPEALPLLLSDERMKPFLPAPGSEGAGGRKGGVPSAGGIGGAPALDSKDPLDRVAARLAAHGIDFNNEFSG